MIRNKIIIPSWSPLSIDMQVETGAIYPAFVRLGGMPLYIHILNTYKKYIENTEFVFILSENAPELEISRISDFRIKIIRLPTSNSLAETIYSALLTDLPSDNLVIHMADTLIENTDLNEKKNIIYTSIRKDLYRWTTIEIDKKGVLTILKDRDQNSSEENQKVCVGVFKISDSEKFKACLIKSLKLNNLNKDPFFLACESYSLQSGINLVNTNKWLDCGHLDTYYESRLSFQNLRHFNTLTYDEIKGVVTKISSNTSQYRNQVRWFNQVPDELSYFLPRIYESSDGENPFITMELLSIPTLSDLFVNSRLELGAWNEVAKKISHIMQVFQKYNFESTISKQIASNIYIDKTRSRILEIIKQDKRYKNYGIINNNKVFTLQDVLLTLEEFSRKLNLLQIDKLSPIHGDMCFSNLLYDQRSRQIKMIDPRGEFGLPGIYGDLRYDKAKLIHSCSGGYDFIVSDMFEVSVDDENIIKYLSFATKYHELVHKIITANILPITSEKKEVEAIQSLLFLSMIPLHSDKPNRQLAMLYVGLSLYSSLYYTT